ncbi:MAG: protein kinase [Acidobacteria bacterium]|nr:protein kinase [Acidobacteriota bacterium]
MTPERYQKLTELFHAALDQPPELRAAFLAQACGDDHDLQAQVEKLLARHEESGDLIDPSVRDAGMKFASTTVLEQEAKSMIGRQIGIYRIVKEIGRGGMGVVYQAVRTDDPHYKPVAIKILKRGMDTDSILSRFYRERRILAGLDHPHIARLLDGGTTPDGLPYFVMEYIDGQPIHTYCDTRRLSITERLKLFRTVCSAIQYAHQNLVVHRDLKPGNILVTADGTPKLLDFGIAKVIKSDESSQEDFTQVDLTQPGQRPMTPAYASPEQIRGEVVTTATDVYCLGVLLYELLTGQLPYQLSASNPDETLKIICTQKPGRPSTLMNRRSKVFPKAASLQALEAASLVREGTADRLRRRLTGDLDNIVLMALRKDPRRRYSSVEQFSEDIRRHLEGRPVSARQDTFGYRAGKFIQRNKLGVGVAAALTITLLGGIMTTTWQARVAQVERAKAERRFNELRKLARAFIFDFHDKIENLQGSTPARELLVKQGLEYLDNLAAEAAGDQSLQYDLAMAYQKVGDIQGRPYAPNLGDSAGAVQSYRKSLHILEKLTQDNPQNQQVAFDLSVGIERVGDILARTGDTTGAIQHYTQAFELQKTLLAAAPSNGEYQKHLAMCFTKLGDTLTTTGDLIGALDKYQQALFIRESLLNSALPQTPVKRAQAVSYYRIGNTLEAIADLTSNRIGDLPEVQAIYREALTAHQKVQAMVEELSATDHVTARTQHDLASSLIHVSKLLAKTGATQEALQTAQKALELCEKLADADPKNVEIRSQLSLTNHWFGDIDLAAGNPTRAIKKYQTALLLRETLLSTDPTNAEYRQFLVGLHQALGKVYFQTGEMKQALSHYRQALELGEATLETNPSNAMLGRQCSQLLNQLSAVLVKAGQEAEARRLTLERLTARKTQIEQATATPWELTEYAWLLLTCEPVELRNPALAIVYAYRANRQPQETNLATLQVLALAYTTLNDPIHATETINKFLHLLPISPSLPEKSRLQTIEMALEKYKRH